MEDHAATRRGRLSHLRRGRRRHRAGGDADRHHAAVALRLADDLHRLGLSAGGIASPHQGGCVKVRYFAWVRERIGLAEEDIDPPAGVATVGELVTWLAQRGEGYAYAFENPKVIRAAIDKSHVRADARLAGAGEIAFFPPMTGGCAAAPMTTTIRLQHEAFDIAAEVTALTQGRTD